MPIKVQSRVICPQPILYSLTIVLLTNHLFPPPFTDVNTSSSFTPVLQPCVPLSAVFLLFLPSWWRCLTNSFLTPLSLSLIKSTLPSLIPLSWQWWMAAFTRLSPLHISLPIRLTTHIHTHWLSILLSLHLPQTLALFLPSFTLIRSVAASIFSSNPTPLLPPSCALFSHFLVFFLSLPLAFSLFPRPSFVVRFHTQYRYHSSLSFLYIFGWLKRTIRQRDDRGVILSKGWVGLQYTRLPHEEAMWAFFCFLPGERESVCVCVGLPVIMMVWYARSSFCMQALSPNIKGLDYE